jgi:hypothetical protein
MARQRGDSALEQFVTRVRSPCKRYQRSPLFLRVSLVDANSPLLLPAPAPRRQIEEYDAGTSVGLGTVICWEAGRAAQLKQMS